MAPASFDAAKDIPDLSGKVIVVTGGMPLIHTPNHKKRLTP